MTPITESRRHSIRDGLDPASQEVWARQGTGRTCVVCATVISPDQIEKEIVVRTALPGTSEEPTSQQPLRLSQVSRVPLIMMAAVIVLLLPTGSYANSIFTYDFTGGGFSARLMAQMNTALTIADNELGALFSNNATINIRYQATAATGLADANFNIGDFPPPFDGGGMSYATAKSIMAAHSALHPENTALTSTVANLPATMWACPSCDPT